MTRPFSAWIAVLVLTGAALSACPSGPSLRSNYDKSVNFAQYKTYAFFSDLGTNKAGYSTLITKDFEDAIRREMDARGYQYTTNNPQLLVNFNANARENVDVRSSPSTDAEGCLAGISERR